MRINYIKTEPDGSEKLMGFYDLEKEKSIVKAIFDKFEARIENGMLCCVVHGHLDKPLEYITLDFTCEIPRKRRANFKPHLRRRLKAIRGRR